MSVTPPACHEIDESSPCTFTDSTILQTNTLNSSLTSCGSSTLSASAAAAAVSTAEAHISEDTAVSDAHVENKQSLSNCTMLTLAAVCYFFIAFVPDIAQQLVDSSSQIVDVSPASSVPTDGPSTIYQAAKPAAPFFTQDSHVYDSYQGALLPAALAVEKHGYAFVMYYASWSAMSMLARKEFDLAAGIMNGRVRFVAIHCWYESTQCRSKYKFYRFPSFYFYASGMDMGFQYTGIDKAEYFIRFVESLLNPITHILNSSQLNTFISTQESSLVGYFNLSQPEPTGRFQQFYYASLRSIEKDFLQPVRFGVLSNKTFASKYSMNDDRDLLLVRSVEENLVYPRTNNFTSTAIAAWVEKYKVQPLVKWFFPNGKKSAELYETLKSGPTVVLLTPHNACSVSNGDTLLLREVVLDLYSCRANNETKTKLTSFIMGSIKAKQEPSTTALCLVCRPPANKCCYSIDSPALCQVCELKNVCTGNCMSCLSSKATLSTNSRNCYSFRRPTPYLDDYEVCCRMKDELKRHYTDPYIQQHRHCNILSAGHRDEVSFSDKVRLPADGHTCKYNVTPNFLAMDSGMYSELTDRFGIHSQSGAGSHLALVDLADESYYVMKGNFNKSNIVTFLEDFSSGNIVRSRYLSSIKKRAPSRRYSGKVFVKEINSVQLEQILSARRTKDVVVYFYSKWCLHCQAVNYLFLSSVKYLTKFTSIQFFRVDISANTLSWKYSVNRVPTITLFPFRGEADMLPLTDNVEQMLRYILEGCSIEHLIQVAVSSSTSGITQILPHLRSRITSLERRLADTHCNVHVQYGQAPLRAAISQRRYNNRKALLNLRKLYLSIYRSALHTTDSSFTPTALHKLINQMVVSQKHRLV